MAHDTGPPPGDPIGPQARNDSAGSPNHGSFAPDNAPPPSGQPGSFMAELARLRAAPPPASRNPTAIRAAQIRTPPRHGSPDEPRRAKFLRLAMVLSQLSDSDLKHVCVESRRIRAARRNPWTTR
jgi:hypothetical protein